MCDPLARINNNNNNNNNNNDKAPDMEKPPSSLFQGAKHDGGEHDPPCEHLSNVERSVADYLETLADRMDEMITRQELSHQTQEKMAEIITAWDNAQGFVNTMSKISKLVRWATGTGMALALLWHFVLEGRWPK